MNALLQQYPISLFGVTVALSMLAGLLLAIRAARTAGFKAGGTARALFIGALAGLFCARAAAVLLSLDLYHGDWWGVLRLYEGGYLLNFGLLGGLAAASAYMTRVTRRAPVFLDALAAPLFVGLALGQLACLFSGEGLGFRVPEAYAYFPLAVFLGGGAYFPLFLARALWYLIICAVLRVIAPRRRRYGDVMLWGVMLYCAAGVVFESMSHSSVFIEFVRVDQALCMLAALAVLVVLFRRRRGYIGPTDILMLPAAALMTGVAFFAEFYMGADTQAAYWTLMALALAAIVACGAALYTRRR